MATKKRPPSASGSLLELILIVAVALGLALGIQAFLVKPYRIPSESMVPTLQIGQRVLVNRIGHALHQARGRRRRRLPPAARRRQDNPCGSGHPPAGRPCDQPTDERDDVNFIKRVVAGPGDQLAIDHGHVILNGKRQMSPSPSPAAAATAAITRPRSRFPPGTTS